MRSHFERMTCRRGAAMRAGLVCTGLSSMAACANAAPLLVVWQAGLLTVHAADASRQEVWRAVARLTHTPIGGIDHASGSMSIDLEKEPLGSALRRLAGREGDAITDVVTSQQDIGARHADGRLTTQPLLPVCAPA